MKTQKRPPRLKTHAFVGWSKKVGSMRAKAVAGASGADVRLYVNNAIGTASHVLTADECARLATDLLEARRELLQKTGKWKRLM